MRPVGTTPPPTSAGRPSTVAPFPSGPSTIPDRVMAAVAREPRPSVWRAFVTSLLGLHLGDAGAALRSAWRLAFERARPVMPLVRLQSLLLVVVLAALLGAGGVLAAGGAVRVFEQFGRSGPDDRQPAVTVPSPGSSVAPGGDVVVEQPSGDDPNGPGRWRGTAGRRGTPPTKGRGPARAKSARMPQLGRHAVKREAGQRRMTRKPVYHAMMVRRPVRHGKARASQAPRRLAGRLPPSTHSPSPARLPDRIQSKRNPARATEAGPREATSRDSGARTSALDVCIRALLAATPR